MSIERHHPLWLAKVSKTFGMDEESQKKHHPCRFLVKWQYFHIAKYFAIVPAAFVATYPQLEMLNVMQLSSPTSAILSAVIFNALIIICLIPLALRGVKYRPVGAASLLRRNLLIYGLGGVIAPFIGIKLIDIVLSLFGLA